MARYIKLVGCSRFVDQETGRLFQAQTTTGADQAYPVDDNLADRLLDVAVDSTGRAMFVEVNQSQVAKPEPKTSEDLTKEDVTPDTSVEPVQEEEVKPVAVRGRKPRGSRNRPPTATESVEV
jgi:hypothetical protein